MNTSLDDKDHIDFSELPALKPCPFCGSQTEAHEEHAFIETQGTKWGQVNCCNAEVRTGYGPLSDWIEDAIEAWNERPIEDALNKRIKELEAKLARVEWQSIDTAPDNDDYIIVYVSRYGSIDIANYGYMSKKQKVYMTASGRLLIPTHWMPLPKPPEQDDE